MPYMDCFKGISSIPKVNGISLIQTASSLLYSSGDFPDKVQFLVVGGNIGHPLDVRSHSAEVRELWEDLAQMIDEYIADNIVDWVCEALDSAGKVRVRGSTVICDIDNDEGEDVELVVDTWEYMQNRGDSEALAEYGILLRSFAGALADKICVCGMFAGNGMYVGAVPDKGWERYESMIRDVIDEAFSRTGIAHACIVYFVEAAGGQHGRRGECWIPCGDDMVSFTLCSVD